MWKAHTILISSAIVLAGIAIPLMGEIPVESIEDLFEGELERRGIAADRLPDGRYLIPVEGRDLTISLDNLRRDYARDGDPAVVVRFVDTILGTPQSMPPWEQARTWARLALEPSDHHFEDTFFITLTEQIALVAVVLPPDESRISWVTNAQLKRWSIERDDFVAAAKTNMASLLSETPLVIEVVDGKRLGMLESHSPLKASLIASPNFRQHVEIQLGWPVLAVTPARDFVYLIPEVDRDLIGRLGSVVVREYSESPYPVSTEVLKISDDGISALGAFEVPE